MSLCVTEFGFDFGAAGGQGLDLLFTGSGRELAREQEVAGVSRPHLHHVADDAQRLDTLHQKQLN